MKYTRKKNLIHYINSDDVCKDIFDYIMQKIKFQCNMYKKGQDKKNNEIKNNLYKPLFLCGYNSANYDLYFLIN